MPQKYGYMANMTKAVCKPCLVCGMTEPNYSWTDLNGEAYCVTCGTPYQLMNGKLQDGETYPRINIKKSWIPLLCQYYKETGKGNGCGTFMLAHDYQDQIRDRKDFNTWIAAHKELMPIDR